MKPFSVAPVLPDSALPETSWADAFEVSTQRRFSNMRELALATVGSTPSWVKQLFRIRNQIVAPFGLKPDGKGDAPRPETRTGFFPILHEGNNRVALGMDDAHLNFCVVIERYIKGAGHLIWMTTLVRCHNAFGKAYIRIVAPFHKLSLQLG